MNPVEQQAPDVVVYHHPCLDGFTAAWAIHRRWPDQPIRFLQGAYGKPLTTETGRKIGFEELRGKNVVLVDFSMPASDLLAMGEIAHSVTVLDHHKSAQDALVDFIRPDNRLFSLSMEDFGNNRREMAAPRVRALFDMEHSGAYLAWVWAHGGGPDYVTVPMLVQYVEDRDMWWKAMPFNREIHANIAGYDWTFEDWDEIHSRLEDHSARKVFIREGVGAYRRYQKALREMVRETAREVVVTVDQQDYHVPACNVPYAFASDACELLQSLHPTAPFALAYYEDLHGQKWSIRSNGPIDCDVSLIAKAFGGGGHVKAGGFRTEYRPIDRISGRSNDL